MATKHERNGQNQPPQQVSDGKLALNAKEAARSLSISERLLWTLTNQGKIPHMRLGKRVLYPVDLLRDWFNKQVTNAMPA